MNTSLIALVSAASAALLASRDAAAAYLGLGVRLESTIIIDQQPRSVFRVYAVFDDFQDGAYGGGGQPLLINCLNPQGTGPGGNFLDSTTGEPGEPGGGNLCNALVGVVDLGADPLFINGNSFAGDLFWSSVHPGGLVQFGGVQGEFMNAGTTLTGWGIALLQLTVNQGDNVAGTMVVGGSHYVDGQFSFFEAGNQTFTTVVPAPGALALMVMLAVARGNRRRHIEDNGAIGRLVVGLQALWRAVVTEIVPLAIQHHKSPW